MNPLAASFRQSALAFLGKEQERLSRQYPHVKFGLGQLDPWPIYLSALIQDAQLDEPDLVELVITVANFDSAAPSIEADVVWGADGNGAVEGNFAPNFVVADQGVFDRVHADLPRLIAFLTAAVERRRPHNW